GAVIGPIGGGTTGAVAGIGCVDEGWAVVAGAVEGCVWSVTAASGSPRFARAGGRRIGSSTVFTTVPGRALSRPLVITPPSRPQRAGLRVDPVIDKVDDPGVREALLVLQRQVAGDRLVAGADALLLPRQPLVLQDRRLVHVDVVVDRVDAGEVGQQGVVAGAA